jgi:hypothetical protein
MGVVCFHLLFGPDGPQRVLVNSLQPHKPGVCVCLSVCVYYMHGFVCVYACGCLHVGLGACLCVCL